MDPNANISSQVVIAGCCSIAFSVIFFGLRLLSKRIHEQRYDASDISLGCGLILTIAVNAIQLWTVGEPVRFGTHQDPNDLEQVEAFAQALLAVQCLYIVALACAKLSFFLLFLRLFPGKSSRRAIYVMSLIIIVWAIGILFASIFQCNPPAATWNVLLRPTASCFSVFNLFIATLIPDIISDLAIFIFPQFYVWKLQISMKSKIALALTFTLGGLAIFAIVIRFSTIFQLSITDQTWTFVQLSVWTSVELAATIVSACLPILRPLVLCILRRKERRPRTYQQSTVPPKSFRGYRLPHEPLSTPTIEEYGLVSHIKNGIPDDRVAQNGIHVTHTLDIRSDPWPHETRSVELSELR